MSLLSDEEENLDEEEERFAVAATFGISAVFNRPKSPANNSGGGGSGNNNSGGGGGSSKSNRAANAVMMQARAARAKAAKGKVRLD